jgi:glycosyltransferase involved in cell wall biosynthesis
LIPNLVNKKRIVCTVSNDLTTDQRMQRICTSLTKHGYEVLLVGRSLKYSKPLPAFLFHTLRLECWATNGFLFYAEWNVRLFFFLLFERFDVVYTVDLDTMPCGVLASALRRKQRFFDAHEYFTEVPEVTNRPFVKAFWGGVARVFIPYYPAAITVGAALAEIFEKQHGIPFGVVRNMPNSFDFTQLKIPQQIAQENQNQNLLSSPKIILYQGALNEGRGIVEMLEALTYLENIELWLAGEGDLSDFLRQKAKGFKIENKVKFLGNLSPDDLKNVTQQAWLGLNLLENKGLSYYYSLANKFFDYVQAGVPSLCVAFPEYQKLNADFEVAVLIDDISPKNIAQNILDLQQNQALYAHLTDECKRAREVWIWENEEKMLFNCLNFSQP